MAQRLEIVSLQEKVALLEGENKFVNDQNDALIENKGELGLENDQLKKNLALAEERQKRYFDFWRSAEEELTKQLELNEKLKAELEAEKSKARIDEQGEKKAK